MRTVAALYVDPRGAYPKMPGVDCWDEERDADKFPGGMPCVAHPPCGPWGALAHLCRNDSKHHARLAVQFVRANGGVLEHPAHSKLWLEQGLPLPNELPDAFSGHTVEVNQVHWGHRCTKPTWLYCVGVARTRIEPPMPDAEPTHGIWYGDFERAGRAGPTLLGASKEIRRRTPPLFAEWLVSLARSSSK
jgi:hypothetical protein